MNGFKAVAGHVRVDLRGGNIGMAEKFLHDPEICSAF